MKSAKIIKSTNTRLPAISTVVFLILYSSVAAAETVEPAAYWSFDELLGDTACDSAGDNDGTVYGAQWTPDGRVNGALDFRGKKHYVMIGSTTDLEYQRFTLSFWAQLNNPSKSFQAGISKGLARTKPVKYSYGVVFHNGRAIASITNSQEKHINVYAAIKDSDWHMWTVTVADGLLTLYKDAVPQDVKQYRGEIEYYRKNNDQQSADRNYSCEKTGCNNFVIGGREKGFTAFDGRIDEVIFYDTALTAGQIKKLYDITARGGKGLLLARKDF